MTKQKSSIREISALIYVHGANYAWCNDENCSICNQIKILKEEIPKRTDYKEHFVATAEIGNVIELVSSKLTEQEYLNLKKEGRSDSEIAESLNLKGTQIHRWKKDKGIEANRVSGKRRGGAANVRTINKRD